MPEGMPANSLFHAQSRQCGFGCSYEESSPVRADVYHWLESMETGSRLGLNTMNTFSRNSTPEPWQVVEELVCGTQHGWLFCGRSVNTAPPLRQHTAANQEWALDFAHDTVAVGRAIRVLSVVDAYTRECLALEVDTSFASRRATRVLDEIIEHRGEPRSIRCDNGPELTSRHFLAWCIERKIELVHIQPGKPTQNAHVESFHGRLGEECLRISWFHNVFDARQKIAI